MLRAAGLVIALLVAGCSGNPPVPTDSHMSVSSHFSALEIEAVIDAADQWYTATGGVVSMSPSVGDDGAIRVYPGVVDDTTLGQMDSNGDTADIRINMDLVRSFSKKTHHTEIDLFHDIVLHEIGHAFGLRHLPSGLMVATGYSDGCIDQLTVDVFCSMYSCPPSAAPTCN